MTCQLQTTLVNKRLRVSIAKPFAKYLTDPSMAGEGYKTLEMSAQVNIRFKDIDVDKAFEVLNQGFYITPPSKILVLKNLLTMEEVS